MKKISLKNLNLIEVEQLSREELKNVVGGSGYGSGGSDCGENAHFETFANKCVCDSGYYFSSPYNKCVEGTGSGGSDRDAQLDACRGKHKGEICNFYSANGSYITGQCDYYPVGVSGLHCLFL